MGFRSGIGTLKQHLSICSYADRVYVQDTVVISLLYTILFYAHGQTFEVVT